MYLAYCTSRGSSKPYSASICARASGVSFWSLNGEPGRSCMRNQVAVAMTIRMTKALTRRLSVYLNITHISSPGLGRARERPAPEADADSSRHGDLHLGSLLTYFRSMLAYLKSGLPPKSCGANPLKYGFLRPAAVE